MVNFQKSKTELKDLNLDGMIFYQEPPKLSDLEFDTLLSEIHSQIRSQLGVPQSLLGASQSLSRSFGYTMPSSQSSTAEELIQKWKERDPVLSVAVKLMQNELNKLLEMQVLNFLSVRPTLQQLKALRNSKG